MFSGARQLGFIIRLGTGSDEKIIYGKFARTIKGFCSRSFFYVEVELEMLIFFM